MKCFLLLSLLFCCRLFSFSQNIEENTWIIEPRFTSVQKFVSGVAVVELNRKYGAINYEGNIVVPIVHSLNSSKLKSLVKQEKEKNVVDKGRGKIIYYDEWIIADSKDGKWGFRKYTLNDYIKDCVGSWELYERKELNKIGTFDNYVSTIGSYEEYLRLHIESDINKWQKKGEFESTAQWNERVNEKTRKEKIKELGLKYGQEYTDKINEYRKKCDDVVKEYKDKYQKCRDVYYEMKVMDKKADFKKASFDLMDYDADNQTFLIKSNKFGDILIPVPLAEAPFLKQNWEFIKKYGIVPEFTPSGDDVVLTSVAVTIGTKKYVYDSHTEAKYATADINYNFNPLDIDISDISDTDYTFEPVEVIQSTVVQTSPTVKGLNINNATIERKIIDAAKYSDVDVNIPQNAIQKNSNTFALIIANEDYQLVSDVQYAGNDGKLFADYCQKTLGLPLNHVMVYNDATLGNMLGAVIRFKEIGEAYNGKINVIFYYAGHGIPDETSKDAYLLPVDGDGSSIRTCYKQSELYAELASIKAESVVVFMDACFSGSLRGDGMLVSARGVAIKAKKSNPIGNMVVFSAAQGDETAYPYKEQRHGMFTYYLLKKLQETKGEATLGEISDYVTSEVRKQSIVINGKMQTPTLTSSSAVGDTWRNWKLK